MKTLLTPCLLDFLIKQGYTYFLSKTTCAENNYFLVIISLNPVASRPVLSKLPLGCDTYFKFTQEPRLMANGIDGTEIFCKPY